MKMQQGIMGSPLEKKQRSAELKYTLCEVEFRRVFIFQQKSYRFKH